MRVNKFTVEESETEGKTSEEIDAIFGKKFEETFEFNKEGFALGECFAGFIDGVYVAKQEIEE